MTSFSCHFRFHFQGDDFILAVNSGTFADDKDEDKENRVEDENVPGKFLYNEPLISENSLSFISIVVPLVKQLMEGMLEI